MSEVQVDNRLTRTPTATAAMLIRRPVAEVFEAFVDPAITSHFWFTSGSARLVENSTVTWEWGMYGVSAEVAVQAIDPNCRILIEWPGANGQTTVEWTFTPHGAEATFVTITNTGFAGSGDEILAQVIDSTEGFAIVLAGLKAYLEHGIELNLVGDRFPQEPEG